jgi:hypothetical protein
MHLHVKYLCYKCLIKSFIQTRHSAICTKNTFLFLYCRFQEIVPLNAGNILGAEDNGPAKKWLALIGNTLNNLPGTSGGNGYYTPSPIPQPVVESNADFVGSARLKNSSFFHRWSFQTNSSRWGMDTILQLCNHDYSDYETLV